MSLANVKRLSSIALLCCAGKWCIQTSASIRCPNFKRYFYSTKQPCYNFIYSVACSLDQMYVLLPTYMYQVFICNVNDFSFFPHDCFRRPYGSKEQPKPRPHIPTRSHQAFIAASCSGNVVSPSQPDTHINEV